MYMLHVFPYFCMSKRSGICSRLEVTEILSDVIAHVLAAHICLPCIRATTNHPSGLSTKAISAQINMLTALKKSCAAGVTYGAADEPGPEALTPTDAAFQPSSLQGGLSALLLHSLAMSANLRPPRAGALVAKQNGSTHGSVCVLNAKKARLTEACISSSKSMCLM